VKVLRIGGVDAGRVLAVEMQLLQALARGPLDVWSSYYYAGYDALGEGRRVLVEAVQRLIDAGVARQEGPFLYAKEVLPA
jgi:hypothetical protein